MKLRNIFLFAAAAATVMLTGCKKQEPFDTQTEDDMPRILKPYNESNSGSFTYTLANPDAHMLDSCVVTPSAYTTVRWYLDGQCVCEGLKIDTCFLAGGYKLRIEATTTKGNMTYREGTVTVNPYDVDPYSAQPAAGRHFVPGTEVQLNGVNLSKVADIQLCESLFPGVGSYFHTEPSYKEDSLIRFVVPAMEDGTYYLRFLDDEGKYYGVDKAQIHNGAVVLGGYTEFSPGQEWVLTGVNLSNIVAVKLGDQEITALTVTETSVTLTAPDLAEGDYDLSLTNADGSAVMFVTADGVVNTVKAHASLEHELWTGPVNIDWNADLVKVTKEQMADVPVGSTILVYWTEDTAPGYHAFRITSPWWGDDASLDDNFVPRINDFPIANPYPFEWDARCKALIEERGAMCVLGAGYTINKITWK